MKMATIEWDDTYRVQVYNESTNALPAYATAQAAGMDVRASLSEPLVLAPGERKLIPTGLYIALPDGIEMQVRPRSGLALKQGITVLNTPGTVDADYRGEVGVIVINLGREPFTINNGERIAQLVFHAYEKITWSPVKSRDALPATERGAGGFGHTGKL